MPKGDNLQSSAITLTNSAFAARLRGFGPLGIIATLLIVLSGNILLPNMIAVPVCALLVLLWVKLSHTPWVEIGYVRPKSWLLTIIIGVILGIALKLLMKAVIMPLFGAHPINEAYHFLAGNRALLPAAIWAMLNAGFSEETLFRGYAFERLRKLLGSSSSAITLIVLLTSALFGLAHYGRQGLDGLINATITGLVFGGIYAATRSIWVPMIAHSAFDLTALAIIYLNLELAFARWIFR